MSLTNLDECTLVRLPVKDPDHALGLGGRDDGVGHIDPGNVVAHHLPRVVSKQFDRFYEEASVFPTF